MAVPDTRFTQQRVSVMFDPNITTQITEWLQAGFLVLDLETTGLSDDPMVDICEVAIMNHHGETLLQSLVKPRRPIPVAASQVHGISTTMVKDAPSFQKLYPEIAALLNGQKVVAYNAPFEEKILAVVCEREKLPAPAPAEWICAMRTTSAYLGVQRFLKLSVACSQLGVQVSGAHRALGDCRLTLALMQKMAGS